MFAYVWLREIRGKDNLELADLFSRRPSIVLDNDDKVQLVNE